MRSCGRHFGRLSDRTAGSVTGQAQSSQRGFLGSRGGAEAHFGFAHFDQTQYKQIEEGESFLDIDLITGKIIDFAFGIH